MRGNVAVIGLLLPLSLGFAELTMAQEPPGAWNLSLGFQESNQYDRLFDGVVQEDQILDSPHATFGYSTRTQRARFGLFGRVGADLYRTGTYSDRLNYGGGFSWDFAPSERLHSVLSQNVSRGFMVQTLSELGVLAPNIDTFGANTSWDLEYRTSPRTTLSTSFRYDFAEFDSKQPISGSQFVLSQPLVSGPFLPFSGRRGGGGDLVIPDAQDAALQILATEGIGVSKTTTQWVTATAGLQHQFTQYSTFGFDILGGYRSIDRNTSSAQEGAEGGFRVWALKNIGAATEATANYTFNRSLALQPAITIQNVMGGLGYFRQGGRIELDAQAGVSHFQAETTKGLLTPTVAARFDASVSRSTRFGSGYQRMFAQSLGFGRTLLLDLVDLSLTQELGNRVTASLLAGGSFASDPLVEASQYDAVRAGGTVTCRIIGGLTAGTSWFTLQTQQDLGIGLHKTEQKLWSIFMNFSTTWH